MANIQQKIELWSIDRLIPYDKNPKVHTESQIENLAKVIKSQGWDVPIVVDRDGVVIKGHGRRLAAIFLGLKEVPVICRRDLSPAQVKAARLSDNHVAIGDFDTILIKEELASLSAEGFEDLGDMGFSQKELDMMLKDIDTLNIDAFESEQKESETKTAESAPEAHQTTPERTVELSAVLGFKTLPESAERALIKFQSYAESKTSLKGAEAFAKFCSSVVEEIEAST